MHGQDYRILPSLKLLHQGKVRETYEIPGKPDLLLVVASNRISTHNIVHESTVPGKGMVLTALTVHWLTRGPLSAFPHHLVASGRHIWEPLPAELKQSDAWLKTQALVVRKLDMLPIEFIFRSRLTGSLKKAYDKGEDPYGLQLPRGLMEMSPFPQGIVFTPTEKSETDPPLVSSSVVGAHPEASLLAMAAYSVMCHVLPQHGIELIDSKIEIGLLNGIPHLGDELFTPDSSRYVENGNVIVDVSPPWLDKQVARDAAERVWSTGQKNPLVFDDEVIEALTYNYQFLLSRTTGNFLSQWMCNGLFDYCCTE